jgi:PIN domain nuclease of toxin-antitoxin system
MNDAYLIDTHILLWWLSHDKMLSKKMIELIQNPDNTIFVSSGSIWEIVIKKSLGKLKAPSNLMETLRMNDLKALPITLDHVLQVEHLPTIHHDPFDRILIAQCMVENLTMVTTDLVIPQYKIKCW